MLYRFIRFMVSLSLHFYCKRIGWEGYENIPKDKPVLFTPTHSNSFFDALFMAAALPKSVYCLARGDAFRKPLANKILRHFRVLPIYRQSEQEDSASIKNKETFDECQQLFKNGEWVLIFPEGFCTHQTQVMPLKRGFITMAQRAWAEDIDLHIIPVSITYNNFDKWGKVCDIIYSKPIRNTDVSTDKIEQSVQLNERVYSALSAHFPTSIGFKGKKLLWSWWGQFMYYAGWVFQFPIYFLAAYIAQNKTRGTVFHDSVVVGLLSILLPIYYLVILGILILIK